MFLQFISNLAIDSYFLFQVFQLPAQCTLFLMSQCQWNRRVASSSAS